MPEPVTPTGEPEVLAPVGTAVDPAPSDGANPEDKAAADLATVTAELEALRKDKLKADMRANQLENKIKEEETAALKEKEDYKSLAEKLEAELAQIKADSEAEAEAKAEEAAAEAARKEALDFRNSVIAEYPPEVQQAANNLIEKNVSNLFWKDAQDWDDARTQLTDQLDALADVLGHAAPEHKPAPKPKTSANNPAKTSTVDPKDMTLEELRSVLPRADER